MGYPINQILQKLQERRGKHSAGVEEATLGNPWDVANDAWFQGERQ
jgi:hypothetical protein